MSKVCASRFCFLKKRYWPYVSGGSSESGNTHGAYQSIYHTILFKIDIRPVSNYELIVVVMSWFLGDLNR